MSILFFGGDGKIIKLQIARISQLQSDCRFDFCKRSQLFIGTHNEALTVAIFVNSEDVRARERRSSSTDSAMAVCLSPSR
jgi:hypothetical protein